MIKSIFYILLFIGIPRLMMAQSLSLAEAVRIGLERNYGILLEKEAVDIAKRNNNWGEAGRYPSVALQFTQANSLSNINNPASFIAGVTTNLGIAPAINVNWTLFGGHRVRISKTRLEQLEEETMGNASIAVQNAMQAIMQGYYLVLLEDKRLEVLQKSLNLSRERYDYVKIKKELGASVTADLLLAEGNYLTDSTNVLLQGLACRRAMRNVNVLLGEQEIDKPYIYTDSLVFNGPDYNYEVLSTQMNEKNVNIERQYLSQALLHNATELAQSAIYPTIDLRLNYIDNINRQDLSKAVFSGGRVPPEAPITAITANYSASFVVSFNLFNGGRLKRAIENAKVQEKMGEMRIEQLKQGLNRDLLTALDLYRVRLQLKTIASRNLEASEQNLGIGKERLESGNISSFDYRTLQNIYLNAAFSAWQATYNLIDAHVQLLRLTGGIVQD